MSERGPVGPVLLDTMGLPLPVSPEGPTRRLLQLRRPFRGPQGAVTSARGEDRTLSPLSWGSMGRIHHWGYSFPDPHTQIPTPVESRSGNEGEGHGRGSGSGGGGTGTVGQIGRRRTRWTPSTTEDVNHWTTPSSCNPCYP